MTMTRAKTFLGTLWAAAFLLGLGTLFAQTVFGHYGTKASEAWGWFLPSTLPTLALMVSVFVADALKAPPPGLTVSRFMFGLALVLSMVYLALILLTIWLSPLAARLSPPVPPLALMRMSNLWQAPLQALVAAALGVFFVNAQKPG